ncbi:hypothetical protein [Butyricimonas virosa]|uniref:hypothetical protein n=1 Tax=Butyricimonas virosa TaxID=544645 RepID=UPI002430E13F|nr:hypothetical protein [Butyricimonas virosa]
MNVMWLYNHLPVKGQNLACYLEGVKRYYYIFGRSFKNELRVYESHNNWSYEQRCEYRNAKLQHLIHHCYDTVPYYRKKFDEIGISPNDIKTVEDMSLLPILTKDVVMNDPCSFISTSFNKKRLVSVSTSGSTGACLVLKVPRDYIAKQFAIWWRFRHNIGITNDIWQANFGSKVIVPIKQNFPPFWRYCTPLKQVMFSTFHGNPTNYYYYFEEINRLRLKWIHGYPSCIVPFASFILERNLKFKHKIEFVTTGGENLYDYQRSIMFKAFDCMPRTHYGMTESVANFSERIDGVMEVDEDYAAVEFVNSGDLCKIVGTNLMNYSMPLLRYDTSDLALIDGSIGTSGRIVKFVDGRSGDFILFPNGKKIGALSALFSDTTSIKEAQIYQAKDYSITIKYVPHNENFEDDISLVNKLLRERIGDELLITFMRVDKIPRTQSGKLRYVLSDVNS